MLVIDPGNNAGFAIFKMSRLVHFGSFKFKIEKRLDLLFSTAKLSGPEKILVIEDSYLGRNVKTLKSLAEKKGIFKHYAAVHKFEIVEVAPSEWQKIIGAKGKREERKKAAREYVNNKFNLKLGVKDQDAVDAICIGDTANIIRNNKCQKKKQKSKKHIA